VVRVITEIAIRLNFIARRIVSVTFHAILNIMAQYYYRTIAAVAVV